MLSSRTLLAPIAVALLLAIAPHAHAQSSSDKAAAESLFDDARALVTAGKFADACAKLEASLKLYSSINTEYHLADCYEKLGKMASAWIDFQEISTQSGVRNVVSTTSQREIPSMPMW